VAYDLKGLGAGAGQFSKSKTIKLSYLVKKRKQDDFHPASKYKKGGIKNKSDCNFLIRG
jgi:hypothetical protein